ncbi:unnamed protein product, partial [Mesorhabditis spiculigera]
MKTVIITGASSGIGKHVAIHFATKGYAISITARSKQNLEETKRACVAAGCPERKIAITVGDLTIPGICEQIVENTIKKLGSIDVLINNAGLGVPGFISQSSMESLDRQLDLNLKSLHQLTKLAIPHIIKARGTIVNVSSAISQIPNPTVAFYCISKAALDMYTKCLALEMAPQGVRVNSINPGFVNTEFLMRNGFCTEETRDETLGAFAQSHPLGRGAAPEEIARTIFFLASPASSFTTGAIVNVDGGLSLKNCWLSEIVGSKMKTVIVTGASSGIGKGVAIFFSSKGYAVSITARSKENLEKTKQACVEAGCPEEKVVITVGDLTKRETCEEIIENTLKALGAIDVLVNNAGFGVAGAISDSSVESLDKQLDLNLKSLHQLTQLAIPHIVNVKGSIVNVSSAMSQIPYPTVAFYCISKAALDMYTKCLALEMAPKGVRVNSINPGLVHTEFQTRNGFCTEESKDELMDAFAKSHPLGRGATPEEIARTIFFLASPESSFTTGAIMNVDGGLVIGSHS